MSEQTDPYVDAPKRSRTRAIMRHLFPSIPPWEAFPHRQELEKAEHVIHFEANAFLGWRDRLRALVSGHVRVSARIYCQNDPGDTESSAMTEIAPPRAWMDS